MPKDAEKARPPTPWEKFVALARKVVQTQKAEVDKRKHEWRKTRRPK